MKGESIMYNKNVNGSSFMKGLKYGFVIGMFIKLCMIEYRLCKIEHKESD